MNVDLQTYYIGPQLVKRAVLLQVIAQSRQFAVWHEDQVVKRLPIKGLIGQEMALDDYLQYIQQEALAAPRRSSARGGRQSLTAFSLERGSLISIFICQLSSALASHSGTCGINVVFMLGKGTGEPEEICCVSHLRVCLYIHSLHTLPFSLLLLSFSLLLSLSNLYCFDEPTPPGVSMTESRTHLSVTPHFAHVWKLEYNRSSWLDRISAICVTYS